MLFEQILAKSKNYQLAYYIQAAEKLNIKWEILIPGVLVEFNKDGRIWRQLKSISPLNDSVSSTLTMYKNTCSDFLRKNGFNVPKQSVVHNINEIKEFMDDNKIQNIVIKPVRGFGGLGVTILPKTQKEIEDGFKLANEKSLSDKSSKVVVEEFISGNNYRLLVLGDKVIAAVIREPAKVIGDSKSTIRLLIDQKNRSMKELGLDPIQMDSETTKVLASQKYSLESIPEIGKSVRLRINSNLCSGGTTNEYLSKVNKYFKNIAVEATSTTGLKLAGVDIITPDISDPNASYSINEINHNPGLRPHYLPTKGKSVDVATIIQKYILDNLS